MDLLQSESKRLSLKDDLQCLNGAVIVVPISTTQMQNFYAACADLPLRKIVYLGSAIALPRAPTGRPEDDRARIAHRQDCRCHWHAHA
jgi:hypothetical protein